MKKVIIIDGNSLAFGGNSEGIKLPEHLMQAKSDKRDIYLIRKFIKKIVKLKFEMFSNYELIVVFDEKDKWTFRHELDPKYKNKSISPKRKEQKEYVYQQIDELKEMLKKINIPVYSTKQWEADDVIGMLITKYENAGYLPTIITKDKDILQLISNKTRIAFIGNNFTFNYYTRNNVWNITDGLWPDQVIDIKILTGDSSDNIKGLGLKRDKNDPLIDYWKKDEAIELIKRYSSIDNMILNIDKIEEPFRESLIRGKDKIEKTRKLVTIVRDWSLTNIDFSYFKCGNINLQELDLILEDLNLLKIKKQRGIRETYKKLA